LKIEKKASGIIAYIPRNDDNCKRTDDLDMDMGMTNKDKRQKTKVLEGKKELHYVHVNASVGEC